VPPRPSPHAAVTRVGLEQLAGCCTPAWFFVCDSQRAWPAAGGRAETDAETRNMLYNNLGIVLRELGEAPPRPTPPLPSPPPYPLGTDNSRIDAASRGHPRAFRAL
jgi:hypothetical protein